MSEAATVPSAVERVIDSTAAAPRVQTRRVSKRFNDRVVLRGIDLVLRPHERAVLFGANGAGKTTLLRILATLSRPTSGEVVIDGLSVVRDAQAVRKRLGVVAHQPYLYEDLTAGENLRFFAKMYGVPEAEARIAGVLQQVGLADRADDRVASFSRGMQQRLALARATLHRPSVLLLDEPDTGLDRGGLRLLERVIAEHASAGGSLLMTTHHLGFGLANADRALLLSSGRLTRDVPAVEIEEQSLEAELLGR